MKLTEFESGTEITISSSKKYAQRDFETEIIAVKSNENQVVVKPVMVNGVFVRFSDPSVKNVVTINQGAKVYTYHDVVVKTTQTQTKPSRFILYIQSEEDAKAINRREFFRVFLGADGLMQMDGKKQEQEVIIKDVSANGIGVICDKKFRLTKGCMVKVTFVDKLTREKYTLECEVIRCVKHDEQNVIYGCQFPEPNDDMEKFVAVRQRLLTQTD